MELREEQNKKSLDQIEREYWNPGPSMLDTPYIIPEQKEGFAPKDAFPENRIISLNGDWQMAQGGREEERLSGEWQDAITARIPCSVHTALLEAGRIQDPMIAINDKEARQYSYQEWWFKKEFSGKLPLQNAILHFEGICYRAHIWFNNTFLGTHSGMFGTPEYEIEPLLQEMNTLIVKIDNAPARPKPLSDFMDNDEGWHDGVVINCVYGWHYACLPSRGIWAPVWIQEGEEIEFERPFVAAAGLKEGIADICVKIKKGSGKGVLAAEISPKNFEGESIHFTAQWEGKAGDVLHYRVTIPDVKLWWPNGHGEQNLYELKLALHCPEGIQSFQTSFGMRTIEMNPLPEGPDPEKYNWIYTINGKKIFVKGANWCTLDALLRFPKERYERFLGLAKQQHIQLLRAWGGGMPESDTFYDLCDEYGIMVMQEWPTCWDSQKEQPFEELEETVLDAMPRLRCHPSLIMWCGGNESKNADGEAMDMMARYAFELDGSRPFHRTSPWGGSLHNYGTYWDMQDMDVFVQLKSHFLGEFGLASMPDLSSVKKYVPGEEIGIWPPDPYGSIAHHTPRFNQFQPNDMDYLSFHAAEFEKLDSLEDFIWATQIAQATGIRHTLESFRAAWPQSTGVCYYKLTDVYPAASWSTIDYYGVPKLSYYILADSYEPLHAAVIFQSTKFDGELRVPVYVMDDADDLKGKSFCAIVRAWDRDLKLIQEESYPGSGSIDMVSKVGEFVLGKEYADGRLVLITAELTVGEGKEPVHRTFYWLNYQSEPGVLHGLPETALRVKKEEDGLIRIINQGAYPAVGVTIECEGAQESFTAEDSVFWLNPGEERLIRVNRTEGIKVSAFNAPGAD